MGESQINAMTKLPLEVTSIYRSTKDAKHMYIHKLDIKSTLRLCMIHGGRIIPCVYQLCQLFLVFENWSSWLIGFADAQSDNKYTTHFCHSPGAGFFVSGIDVMSKEYIQFNPNYWLSNFLLSPTELLTFYLLMMKEHTFSLMVMVWKTGQRKRNILISVNHRISY